MDPAPAGRAPSGSDRIRSLLAPYPDRSPERGAAGAAVMILLREGAAEPEVLLIERSQRLDDPASGQIALPGGHAEPSDPDLKATALRELEEEVGLRPVDLHPPIRYVETTEARRFGLSVSVFAAALGPSPAGPRPADPREVASVFWARESAVRSIRRVERETSNGPQLVEAAEIGPHVLWGFTLRVLRGFFEPRPTAPR
ncbi:MAG TPA: CoA pyrophosphatase [Thermoplasmata archaeon]|nr:CoA pyrophosphatase [Thermoplasmata archaeon]